MSGLSLLTERGARAPAGEFEALAQSVIYPLFL